jgi:Putative Flp pilus-assembly TadE/G-like
MSSLIPATRRSRSSRNLISSCRNEAGQTAVVFAFVIVIIVGIAALVIDVGLAYRQESRLQAVADAAALAGAQELPADAAGAQAVALEYIAAHGIDPDDSKYDISITTPYNGDVSLIEVEIGGEVGYFLGPVVGVAGTNANGRSVADADIGDGGPISDASIIALDPDSCKSLEVNAGGQFVSEGPILVNSNCSSFAAEISCGTNCTAQTGIESVGGVKKDEKCVPCAVSSIPPFADPLAHLLPPCFTGGPTPCTDVGTLAIRHGTAANPQLLQNSTFNFQPGIYYGGMDLGGTVSNWAPGVYVIAGGGIKINTSTAFTANGVFIYNTNDPTCPSCSKGGFGAVEINTSSLGTMSAMTTGPYAGLLFFQDRANTMTAKFNPSSTFGQGTVYFPNAHMDLNPSATTSIQIIANTIKINNSTTFTADYNGDSFFHGDGEPTVRLIE